MTKKIQTNSLTDGLILYLPFSGKAKDESGNGHAVTVNGASLTFDRFGVEKEAFHFSGGSNIMVQNSNALNIGRGDYSIVSWVKLDKVDQMRIYSHGSAYCNPNGPNSNAPAGYMLRTNKYNQLHQEFTCTTGKCGFGSTAFTDGNQKLLINQWYFVVNTVKRGEDSIVYINGLVDSIMKNTDTCDITYNNNPLIGYSASEALYGDVDDLRIYNRALSSYEVQQLYSASSTSNSKAVNLKGISTLREGQVANECFEAEVRFDVPGKTESLTYITTQEANGYSYVRDNKYSGSAYLEVLKLANIALKYSASYREFKAVSENSYSTTIGVVHRLPVMFANPTLNTLGREIYKTTTPEDFKFKCGDKIIATYDSFITVTATLNYILKSKSDAEKFKSDISISNGINNWLQGNIDTSYTDRFSKYSGYLSLTIEQFGGNPAALTNVVSKLGFCELSKISSCAELLASVNEYIFSDTFEQQLDHSRWNTRFIANLEDYPISTIPEVDTTKYQSDYIPDDLYDARSSLINKLTQVTSDYTYLKELKNFITGENCETTAEYSNSFIREVESSLSIVNGYLAKLIDSGSGIQACYSNYAKCVSEIAPNLLENAYDYSKIQISKSICEPINCDYPGISEIGLNGLEQDENWYIDKFFANSEECYYGCVRTNTACSTADYEDDISNGSLLAPDMCFVAGAAIASMAGIIFL